MSPYKTFLNNTRQYFNSSGFSRFLLSGYIFIFAIGGLLYLLGAFILQVYEVFAILGGILMYAGLILTLLREDMMTMVITSGVISLGSLISWIMALVGSGSYYGYSTGRFMFGPLFYFLAFGTIAVVVFIRAEKFKQMRAASVAARAQAGVPCPRCGAFVSMNSGFCPACGAQNPATQQYGPVQSPPPQAPPPQAPPPQAQAAPQTEPQAPEADASPKCSSCGADIPPGAAFCAKCGAKQ